MKRLMLTIIVILGLSIFALNCGGDKAKDPAKDAGADTTCS